MTKENERELSELSKAFDRAASSISRTGQAFGELAESSKEWTVISRILSGTGMWRLQNQIRAVGQTINIFHKRQEEARKATLEATEANLQLAKSLKEVENALGMSEEDMRKQPLTRMFTKAGRDGIKEYKAMWQEAGKQLAKAEGGLMKSLRPSATSKFLEGGFFKDKETGEGGVGQFLSEVTGYGKVSSRLTTLKDRFKQTAIGANLQTVAGIPLPTSYGIKKQFLRTKGRLGEIVRGGRRGYRKNLEKLARKLGGVAGKISQFFVVGAAFLLKASVWFLAIVTGIALLVFVIKKLKIKKRLQAFEKKFGFFAELFEEIKTILTAVFDVFKAAFAGDGGALWKGLKKLFWAWLSMLETIIKILLTGLWQVVKAIGKGIVKGVKNFIFGRANGGVVRSGELTLVGERGPELVRLPSGARVHTNSESKRMSGGTINVHVNGRVGASDTEIRDIASKVAREINTQMNRQAHTVGRF
tara:strand:+ start:855 stop:2276 length:1422 start_codon:yes stop_codon:yes gene_type:complete